MVQNIYCQNHVIAVLPPRKGDVGHSRGLPSKTQKVTLDRVRFYSIYARGLRGEVTSEIAGATSEVEDMMSRRASKEMQNARGRLGFRPKAMLPDILDEGCKCPESASRFVVLTTEKNCFKQLDCL